VQLCEDHGDVPRIMSAAARLRAWRATDNGSKRGQHRSVDARIPDFRHLIFPC
jgi:hypothetical protein